MKLLAILAHLACLGSHEAALLPPVPVVDTQGMPDLVSTFLLSIKGSLVVSGRARALDAFLEQLNPEVPRSIVSPVTDDYSSIRLLLKLQETDSVILIADDDGFDVAEGLNTCELPAVSRLLLWTWADSPQDVVPLKNPTLNETCITDMEVALAVSTRNGTTFLFYVLGDATRPEYPIVAAEIDVWSPSTRSWERQARPFKRMCSNWQQGNKRSKFTPLEMLASIPNALVDQKMYRDALTHFANSLRPPANVKWVTDFNQAWDKVLNCTLSGFVFFYPLPIRPASVVRCGELLKSSIQVVVPDGLGPSPALLQAVTGEFSAELWCATAGAVLAVAVATALADRAILSRPPLAALTDAPLQALAPLLTQAPPGKTAHRPLSAVWLLMTVVLAAAYQGLLLKELTTAATREINSLQQLEDSGLEVRASDDTYLYVPTLLSTKLQSRVSFFSRAELASAVRSVANLRQSAVIFQNDFRSMIALPWFKHVHMFEIGTSLASGICFTNGSPLQNSLRRTTDRFSEHGLHDQLRRIQSRHVTNGHPSDDDQSAKPLSLSQLKPAFVLLAYCYVVSTLVFVLEIMRHIWFDKRNM
ncbi:Ionotropic receptor 128 [Frankliniella occidentalis]|nr:Ionotropic receptor 128 [Frankliniella occidentalis]